MDKDQALYAGASLLAIYGVAYFDLALSSPSFFIRNMAVRDYRQAAGRGEITLRLKARTWMRGLFALAGVAYFTYRASAPLVDWMPFDWGSHNEDGDWESARDWLRGMLALFGTVWMLSTAERVARLQKE